MSVCIVGMHRSGTSLVAQILNLCGLDLGPPEHLLPPDSNNLTGYFENLGFQEINDSLLVHFRGSWDNPPDLREGWEYDTSLDPMVEQAKSHLGTFSNYSNFGWKDPRTTILIPFWKRVIPDLKFVICVRSPLEVAQSLATRDGFSIEKGVYVWNRYIKVAIRDTEGCPRIFTFYEDLFRDASGQIDRLVEFCGLQKPADESVLKGVISRELKHQACETLELLDKDEIATEYKLFYIGLRSLLIQGFLASVSVRGQNDLISENMSRFLKLMEEFHNQEKMAQLENTLNKKDSEIDWLRKDNSQKNIELERYLFTLKEKGAREETILEAIAQKDSQIDQLQVGITREKQQAEKLMAEVEKKKQEVTSFHTLIEQKVDMIIQLQTTLSAHQQELNRIHSSLGWKIVISYCKVINRIFPHHSKRRKLYDLILDQFKL